MARGRGLYLQIAEPDNLRLAFRKAVKGKADRREVIAYRRNLDDNLANLRNLLLNGNLPVGPYRFFTILDPKERTICAAPFHDRVLHHAVMNICEPELERYSIFDSYACRPGKGLHRALVRAQLFIRRYPCYLKLDIRKYFDSIHQKTLLHLLGRRFKDKRVMDLLETILGSYESSPGCGIPIGNLISQHAANFYLGTMDHWLKEERRIPGYLRYMDDFVLFADSRERLKLELHEVEAFLMERLQLTLKDSRQLNRSAVGVPFLGFRVLPGRVLLLPRSRRRFADKLEKYEQQYQEGSISETELARRVHSLVSFTRVADAVGFRRQILAGSPGCRPEGL